MQDSNALLAAREGDVLVLTLNRREKANAMNEAMQDELVRQLELANEDAGVRAVLIAAAGKRVFSAGADLTEFAELDAGVAARRRRELLVRTLITAIDFSKALVVAVQAKALGAGCMLALLADEVIMADTAEFGMPEIKHDMPTPIGIVILAARGGMSVARQMVQSGASIDAGRAQAAGMADSVVIYSSLKQNSMARAKALAALFGSAFQANKRFMNAGLRAALQSAAEEAAWLQSASGN